jgi:hypothetical protein
MAGVKVIHANSTFACVSGLDEIGCEIVEKRLVFSKIAGLLQQMKQPMPRVDSRAQTFSKVRLQKMSPLLH